jgi:threonine dehydrogenase-like Zn-dependent dehydrogenase
MNEVAVGERVTVEPTLTCGHCKPCRHGAENLCENLEFFGCGYREGGMADVFSVPAGGYTKYPPLSATTRPRSSNPWRHRCTRCAWRAT